VRPARTTAGSSRLVRDREVIAGQSCFLHGEAVGAGMGDDVMRIASIEVKFNPPDPLLDRVWGLRPDPGGWVFRLYDEAGQKLVGGAVHGADQAARDRAVSRVLDDARRKGFTHYRMVDASDTPTPLQQDCNHRRKIVEDIQGKPLERGAMYACVFLLEDGDGTPTAHYEALVRFVGYDVQRPVFADADTWEEVTPDFDDLQRQEAPVVDPATEGWPEFSE